MIVIKCPIRGCEHQTPDRPCDPVYSFLNLRKEEHQQDSGLTNNGMEPNSGSRFLNGAKKNYDVIARGVACHCLVVGTNEVFH